MKALSLLAGCLVVAEVAAPVIPESQLQAQAPAWHSLFDGKSLDGWRGYQMFRAPVGWGANNGVLSKEHPTEDLISEGVYGDFELELEWKISKGGNSGIFYRGTERYNHVY